MTDVDTRLANRILLGLLAGAVAGAATLVIGSFAPGVLEGARQFTALVLDPLGQVFLRMLFFVVIPLVFASLAMGIAQLERLGQLGPLAGRTFLLFFLNMGIAVALGLLVMNVVGPGENLAPEAQASLMEEYGGKAAEHVERRAGQPNMTPMTIVEMFMPRNLFGAFVGNGRETLGDVLPLILFAILVGAAALRLKSDRREKLRSGLEIVNDLMTGIVHFALALAPFAVPALIYSVIIKIGWDIVVALGLFVASCVVVMLLHLFGTMSIWVRLLAKRRVGEFWREMRPVLVTAFSTSSSAATLPTALAVARDQLKVSPPVAGFVLPLGTTMNMAGTALYEGCVVLFVAQVFGIDLSFAQQLTLLLLAVLSAVAVAAIPGGSLPLIAGLLASFGIPPEGIGIILGVDRILDMTRTMVNVGSDVVTTTVVDRYTKLSNPA
ncbi:MAG: sodium:dicarboxylate symporter [Steroidobacteraceae bacterium]|jgi:DAACS family dicarboxylate/amino acid:cation (Na+ or H+) symporter|nr:sodium:dicarboxylate symporter [Steroidobacteraceae bacterium]